MESDGKHATNRKKVIRTNDKQLKGALAIILTHLLSRNCSIVYVPDSAAPITRVFLVEWGF